MEFITATQEKWPAQKSDCVTPSRTWEKVRKAVLKPNQSTNTWPVLCTSPVYLNWGILPITSSQCTATFTTMSKHSRIQTTQQWEILSVLLCIDKLFLLEAYLLLHSFYRFGCAFSDEQLFFQIVFTDPSPTHSPSPQNWNNVLYWMLLYLPGSQSYPCKKSLFGTEMNIQF